MDNIAWHHHPVWPSDFLIRADLTSHGMPGRYEQFWVTKTGGNKFTISCIPFFTYGIALGDEVETDAEFTFTRVSARGAHDTMRVVVADLGKTQQLHNVLHDWVLKTGLPHEWYAPGYLAVAFRSDLAQRPSMQELDQFIQSGDLSIEYDG